MKVLVLEANLLWSVRLARALAAAGYEHETAGNIPESTDAMIAIINLSERTPVELEALKDRGMKILAHAGHRERELIALGQDFGCDRVVSNSEITNKLPQILEEMIHEG